LVDTEQQRAVALLAMALVPADNDKYEVLEIIGKSRSVIWQATTTDNFQVGGPLVSYGRFAGKQMAM
jgi:hypothetical protein